MSEANKRTIRFVRKQAMRRGMLDKLDGLYTDDYVYHGIPMLGDLRGPTAFKELARGFIDAVSELLGAGCWGLVTGAGAPFRL